MKKIIIALVTVAVMIGVFSVTSFAGKADFDVTIIGNEAVDIGDEVTYTVEISGTSSAKLFGFEIELTYDTDMFEYKSGSGEDKDWDDEKLAISEKNGVINLDPVCTKTMDDGIAVTKNGKSITYKIKFKVKSTQQTSSDIKINSAEGMDNGKPPISYDGNWSDLTIKIRSKLATPQNPVWDGATARWDAVTNADSYIVQLYKDGEKYDTEDDLSTSSTSLDLESTMEDGGKYTFAVIADSNKQEFYSSDESAKSGEHTVKGSLKTPKITLSPDFSDGGLRYQITDTNPSGSCKYHVEIYESGSNTAAIAPIETTGKSGNIGSDKVTIGKKYCATVTAISTDKEINNDSSASKKTDAAEAVDAVKSLTIKTQPKRIYNAGDKLDLSEMVITVNYATVGTKDIPYSEFSKITGLSVTEDNGKALTAEDNNLSILVVYGTSSTSFTVTVNSAGNCKHTNTHPEHKDATCGDEGYDRTVCDECGTVVAQTIINPTGEHLFDAWVIEFSPTKDQNGQRKRECAVCGHVETEIIPAVGDGTTSDTDDADVTDDTDDAQTTDPVDTSEEFDDPGDTSDVSKIFLIAVIVIFALILLFIIGGLWLDSRRSKARKAMAARRNLKNKQ